MKSSYLFTDGSVNTKTKIGVGAYLYLTDIEQSIDAIKNLIKTKQFENTSSSKLELEMLIWALTINHGLNHHYIIYTDSQNIIKLLDRRTKLEENQFVSKNGKTLSLASLYIEFYKMIDSNNCEFIKLEGHKPKATKTKVEKIFSLVDKASRKELRYLTGKGK